ncbi:MAG: hypothetical protein ACKOS8_08405, partial [Gemmataceae bacterium]
MELEFPAPKMPSPPRRISWVEVFSLSAVAHGLVVGIGLVVWMGLNSEMVGDANNQGKIRGEAVCFWDEASQEKRSEPVLKKNSNGSQETNSDLVPFTIQMSPIGLAERFAPIGGVPVGGGHLTKEPEFGKHPAKTWFDSHQLPEKTAWLIDCSLSMGIHSHFAKAHRQLQVSLAGLGPESKARVWSFAKYPREIAGTGDWSLWTPARSRMAALDLENTVPAGNTDLASALRVVIATNPDLIQILTDEDQLSERDLASLRRFQSRQATPRPSMRVIVRTSPGKETPLHSICRLAGCSYQVISGSG